MSDDGKTLKNDRRKCYQVRDSFFSCKDALLDSGKSEKEAEKACRTEFKAFEANCPSSWVGHFTRKHDFERKATVSNEESRNSDDDVVFQTHTVSLVSAAPHAAPTTTRSLQQLWELSKLSDKVDLATKRDMKEASEG
ncbi:hypothetical protein PENTCL1PPCAC_21860, partial [Pristionchus entomophagus]